MSIKRRRAEAALLWLLGGLLLLSHGLLLTTPDGSMLRLGGAMLLLALPGLAALVAWSPPVDWLTRGVLGLGLSHALLILLGLLLDYLPLPQISMAITVTLTMLTVLGLIIASRRHRPLTPPLPLPSPTILGLLGLILLLGGLFRFADLGYSEFAGDEVKPLLAAAESLNGETEALFFRRKKGPGEIILPKIVWALTGTITETSARLPFALSGWLAILTLYLLAWQLFTDHHRDQRIALLAAGLFALNGFIIAFARIVQYQQLVIWLTLLTMLCAWHWRQQPHRHRDHLIWAALTGLFGGIGFLYHYDALLLGPAMAYLLLRDPAWVKRHWPPLLLSIGMAGLISGLYFGPYLFRAAVAETSQYLGERIGHIGLIDNNLGAFFHFNLFYNSLYYVMMVSLLLLIWLIRRLPWGGYLLGGLVLLASLNPTMLRFAAADLTFLPFALLLSGALLAPNMTVTGRVLLLWIATAFLGYNFVVDNPGTHIYTVIPAWLLLTALAIDELWPANRTMPLLIVAMLFSLLVSGYLYLLFLRRDVEFKVEWPDGEHALYWQPYTTLPEPDFTFGFGLVHKIGWKTIGGLYEQGHLQGDYQTDGEYGTADWYIRSALRGCYNQSRNFFSRSDMVINPLAFAEYQPIGAFRLANDKGLTLYQRQPVDRVFTTIDSPTMRATFDRTAYPAAFRQPHFEYGPVGADFLDLFRLTEYQLQLIQPPSGGQLRLDLTWLSRRYTPLEFDVFVHLESQAGTMVAQKNGAPDCGETPTSVWPGDGRKTITDLHLLTIPPTTPPGEYHLRVGLYLPERDVRLPVMDETGEPIADMVTLTTLILR